MTDPVGIRDIAERLHVKHQTASVWRHRGLLPEPDWHASGMPLWNWPKIEKWARETGRLRVPCQHPSCIQHFADMEAMIAHFDRAHS